MEIFNEITIGELLRLAAYQYSDRPAIQYLGEIWTYKQVESQTNKIAAGLLAMGVKKGTKVGIWANDRPITLLCLYALLKIGAVAVMLGTSLPAPELKSRLEESDTKFLLFDEGFKDIDFLQVCRGLTLPYLQKCIYIGLSPQREFDSMDTLYDAAKSISPMQLFDAKSQVRDCDPDVILFTSGTTSLPKGVVTSHFSRVNNIRAQAEALETTAEDKFLVVIPIFHCFSLSGNILAAMTAGACVCFPENRRTQTILETIERYRCTILTAVPTLFSALLARKDLDNYDLSSLRTGLIGGSTYPPTLFEKICEKLGFALLPSLGQTEATAGLTMGSFSDSMEVKSNTIGHFMEHIEGCIMDKAGNKLPLGQLGEICIRGYNVMLGYYNRPDLTAQVIDQNGWLHTGDLGYVDEEKNIHLTGRLKELIIRGGENISPCEVENVIAEKSGVRQAKVIGIPDCHYVEEVCACIVCDDGACLTAEEIRETVKARLAYFKVPRYVVFMDSIPLNINGKVDLGKCKKQAMQMLEIK